MAAMNDIGVESGNLVLDGSTKCPLIGGHLRIVKFIEGRDAAGMRGKAGKVEAQGIVNAGVEVNGMQTHVIYLELCKLFVLGHDDADFMALANERAGDVDRVDAATRALERKMVHE